MRGHEHGAADDAGLPGGEAEPIHKISDAEGTYGGENFDDGSFHSSHSSSEFPRGEHGISLSFGGPVLVDGHVQCPTGTHNFANTDSYTVDVYGSIVGAWLLIVLALLVGIGGAVQLSHICSARRGIYHSHRTTHFRTTHRTTNRRSQLGTMCNIMRTHQPISFAQ